ncbi:MAG: hypothetical protein WC503_01055 [Candidatus Shapirobacteria bacterium]
MLKKAKKKILGKSWICPCGHEAKKNDTVYNILGFQICEPCFWLKAPVIFAMKGWSRAK